MKGISMKTFYALIFGLILLPACGKKKNTYEVSANGKKIAVETEQSGDRVSGVRKALHLDIDK
jgi:hypothetical protein